MILEVFFSIDFYDQAFLESAVFMHRTFRRDRKAVCLVAYINGPIYSLEAGSV